MSVIDLDEFRARRAAEDRTTVANGVLHSDPLVKFYELMEELGPALLKVAHGEPLRTLCDRVLTAHDDMFDVMVAAGKPPEDETSPPEVKAEEERICRGIEALAPTAPPLGVLVPAMGQLVTMLARARNLSSWQIGLITGFLSFAWRHLGPVAQAGTSPGGPDAA